MRFQKQFILLSLVSLLGLALFVAGCGSDDDAQTISGSLTDPSFVAVQGEIDNFVDSTIAFITSGLGSISAVTSYNDQIDPVYYGPVQPDSDYVSASYVDGWHVVNITRTRTAFSIELIDSVRFFGNGSVQQSATNIDSLYYKHMWGYSDVDQTISNNTFSGHTDITCTGLNGNATTIDGINTWEAAIVTIEGNTTTQRNFEINSTLTDLVVDKTGSGWAQGCPTSGSITANLQMTYKQGDAAAVVTSWSITLTFDSGTMAATVQHGNIVWTYSEEICSTPN